MEALGNYKYSIKPSPPELPQTESDPKLPIFDFYPTVQL